MNKLTDLRRFINRDNNIVQLLIITAVIFLLMSALEPNKFLRYYNFESISFIFPELGIVAIALMAGLQATTALTRNAQRQSDIVLAQLCAENELVKAAFHARCQGWATAPSPANRRGAALTWP